MLPYITMDYAEAKERMRQMVAVDLTDFNDTRLSSAGELAITVVRDDILIELGDDVLEVSQMSTNDTRRDFRVQETADSLYVVRNLRADSSDAVAMLDNSYIGAGVVGDIALLQRQRLVIGTAPDATPQLGLSETVSPHHMHIRLGNLSGDVHFADLYSATGTTVYLTNRTINTYSPPRRAGSYNHEQNEFRTIEAERQRWSR